MSLIKANEDKHIERSRYDERARLQLSSGVIPTEVGPALGSLTIQSVFRSPYLHFEKLIKELVTPNQDVLELGAGTGLHTYALVQTGARVIASDISSYSLEVLKRRFDDKVVIRVADMEALPFKSESFDVVTCAGSLSYGNPDLVDSEIRRVLRPGGLFICVDSLHHNPIYVINRWINYLRGNRTKSTIKNMPRIKRISALSHHFGNIDVYYYGSISWLAPLLAIIIGQDRTAKLSDLFDQSIKTRCSAFKFVMAAKGRL